MPVSINLDSLATDPSGRRAFNAVSLAVAKSKKIVVVTGAGISCSCGIPDFRSSDGLYNLVKQKYPDTFVKGRDLFDSSLFRDPTSTSLFYTFISNLKRSIDSAKPSPTHRFIKTLDTKGKLLRSYTQNIDGLEERCGLAGSSSEEVRSSGKGKGKIKMREVRNVQLHGDIHRVRCMLCSADLVCGEEHLQKFEEGEAPDCPECSARSEARLARSARPLKVGTLRPAIVLYDEPHPLGEDIGAIQTSDINRKPDLLIIMGTSLKVHGFKKLVKDFARVVHSHCETPWTPSPWAGKVVFVNKTAPGSEWEGIIDYWVQADTDTWSEKTLDEWKKMRPADWEIQKTLVGDADSSFRVVKEVAAGKGKKQKPGRENIPPANPAVPKHAKAAAKSLPSPPSSPSKRQGGACHYSDEESSPSKKRVVTTNNTDFEERGLLFGDTTNKEDTRVDDDAFDMGEVIPVKKTRGRPRVKEAKEEATRATSKRAPSRRKEMFVDLVAL
ncbi:DHS-like NAD/FAD-binding domain-containing protein [Gloeophyllum trabeum ATCC 11539]|uniref:DHS-like NAD/FAD-binding domain-containing protein n=1 Tax=Gloeophyllum trabeum (strain ATCC 11539 / FP-39264 / Madison 617) TaxID=670483 RepID=S7S3G6_GLOTA|nr:DHS-like NAD/FAD-binding domain-containing protein [Gloeophyllum trabeum ATCC 11539]EPQ60379.1 DHS-like NAD/FAD-binding domain-containing protein [Gloeophyllum trabeum ATCC 11539]